MPPNYKVQKFSSKLQNNCLVVTNLTDEILENCQISLTNCYSHYVVLELVNFVDQKEKTFNISSNNFLSHFKNKPFFCNITQYGRNLHNNKVGNKNNLEYFVLFSNKPFAEITKQLIIGLTRYSTRPILHFTFNYDFLFQHPNLDNIRFDVDCIDDKPETIQLLKPLALIKSLNYGIGYGLFLDSDIQVKSNIDDIFNECLDNRESLVLQKSFWDYTIIHNKYIPGPKVRELFGFKEEKQLFPHGMTNLVGYSQNHLSLFEEWLKVCSDPSLQEIRKSEFLHDELLLNCLLWQKNINPRLIFRGLNVKNEKEIKFFYNYNNLKQVDYVDLQEFGLGHTSQSYIPKNKDDIAFFHCVKDLSLATKINKLILEKEINNQPTEQKFKRDLISFYNNIEVNPNKIIKSVEKKKLEKGKININFINGAFFEIVGGPDLEYNVDFIDKKNNEIVYSTTLKPNHWCKTARRYFTNYNIQVKNKEKLVYNYDLNFKDKKVYVALDSKSLGDTIAWFPYVEEFRQQHGCEMVCSTFHNFLFKEEYPNIEFIKPGEVVYNLFAMYEIGCFNVKERIYSLGPHNERPLQKVASELLGLEHREIRPKIVKQPEIKLTDKKYICIAPESTAQCKFWNNPNGWTELVKYLKSKNYEVININEKDTKIKGARSFQGSLKEVIGVLQGCEFAVCLGSGIGWLSWALNKKVVLISGFSHPWVEFQSNCIRVSPKPDVCQGCYSTPGQPLDPSDWNFCVHHKGTNRHFECTKTIEASDVIEKIEQSKLLT